MACWYPARARRPLPGRAVSPRAPHPHHPHGAGRGSHTTAFRSEYTVAVKIKLMRMGKIRAPQYRIVVADARTKRDGRAIETIGKYHPMQDPSFIEVDSARVQHWLSVGAQPTEPVRAILRVTGDWQRFRGEPGAEGTLRVAEPKPSKKALYEDAAREAQSEAAATTPKSKKKAEPKKDEPKSDEAKSD